MLSFRNKRIAVMGMARTGMAAARALRALGAEVILYDRKPPSEIEGALAEAEELGVEARPGTDDVDTEGVDAIVPSPGVRADHPSLSRARRSDIEIISEIELAYRISPAPIIAVTGTNGKTTTTILIAQMLQKAGFHALIAGNVAAGEIHLPLISAAMQIKADGVIVAEISTFQLEWIAKFRPKIGALLNITPDHQDRHTMDEYASLKVRLFANQTPKDFAVLNGADPVVMERTKEVVSRKLLFSRQRVSEEGAWVEDDVITVQIGSQTRHVCPASDIPLPGEHNLENVLAAAAAAIAFGADADSTARAIQEFKPVEHRLEPVAEIHGVRYINNSMCTNVRALERSLEAMGGPIVLIAGGKFKGDEHELIQAASIMAGRARHVVLLGESADALEKAIHSAGLDHTTRAESMEDAVWKANQLAQAGDTVILAPACASFDMFRDFEERGRAFKRAVQRLSAVESGMGCDR